jgi:hypothetical protein
VTSGSFSFLRRRDDTPFEGVDKTRKLDGRRILHAEVDVVVLTVRF